MDITTIDFSYLLGKTIQRVDWGYGKEPKAITKLGKFVGWDNDSFYYLDKDNYLGKVPWRLNGFKFED